MGNVGLGIRIVATHCDSRVCQVNSKPDMSKKVSNSVAYTWQGLPENSFPG